MKEKHWLKEHWLILLTGVIVGIATLVLTAAGNPKNMGFCIACFERDTKVVENHHTIHQGA